MRHTFLDGTEDTAGRCFFSVALWFLLVGDPFCRQHRTGLKLLEGNKMGPDQEGVMPV